LYCFDKAFPYKRVILREIINKRWLSKGLIVSSKRMLILNNQKEHLPSQGRL
jgi:hypothetical protein